MINSPKLRYPFPHIWDLATAGSLGEFAEVARMPGVAQTVPYLNSVLSLNQMWIRTGCESLGFLTNQAY